MKQSNGLKKIINTIKPNAFFLEYGIIFLSIGILGLIQGRYVAWWGTALNWIGAIILSLIFIFWGLFFLCFFIYWWRNIPKTAEGIKIIKKIIIIWFSIIMLYVMKGFNVFKLPHIVYLIYMGTSNNPIFLTTILLK